jgi:hypothetical protein
METTTKKRVAWNKGLTKADHPSLSNSGVKKGNIPWTKGKKFPGVGGRPPGGTPWNKGTKGVCKPNSGSFKKGENMGEDNPSWKGGVTPLHNKIRSSVENRLWIKSVFERDDYTCQKTGRRGGTLVAHHILNFSAYPELRFAIDNGITLSLESHDEFHRIYGKTNNTKEQLEEFLTNTI